jgi:hypothetical protein
MIPTTLRKPKKKFILVFQVFFYSQDPYLLATKQLTSFDFGGFITPIGGTTNTGLGRFVFHFVKKKQQN